MRNMIDGMFRRQQSVASHHNEQDLYAKFRVLGANVKKLKQLGLAIPELEQLLERLDKIHDKKLVRLITELAQFHRVEDDASRFSRSKNVLKICPRCSRDLTESNIIKDLHSDDFDMIVLICECGYVREIKNSIKAIARQSSIDEYPYSTK